uniref:Uncharacterized protein n=1 Tax=Manihot esculenta TaxID=3983 RepID=A0A2C9USB6_MANES
MAVTFLLLQVSDNYVLSFLIYYLCFTCNLSMAW